MADFRNTQHTFLYPSQRHLHAYVIGQPGTGKSRLLESWIMQDIFAGNGVGVIDPHGDLFSNVIKRTARIPEIWKKVIIIDPCDKDWIVNLNPFQSFPGTSNDRIAAFVSDIILKIWKINPTEAPRMTWLMNNSFISLAELGLTLSELPRFLLNSEYRERILPRVTNTSTVFYFQNEYPKTSSGATQWASPLLNKLGGILFDQEIRGMFMKGDALNFRRIIDDKCILLVNIPKGILGENSSALLGAFIVAQLQKAALSRANQLNRKSYYLYLDEFQNYTSDNIKDILSESRKYALSLILAHQYLDQLSPDIRAAVLNTTGSITSFRIGYDDALKMSRIIFPSSDFMKKSNRHFVTASRLSLLNNLRNSQEKGLGWDALTHLLTDLKEREFWIKNRNENKPVHCRSFTMNDLVNSGELENLIHALVRTSGQIYGKPKADMHSADFKSEYPYGSEKKVIDPEGFSRENDLLI